MTASTGSRDEPTESSSEDLGHLRESVRPLTALDDADRIRLIRSERSGIRRPVRSSTIWRRCCRGRTDSVCRTYCCLVRRTTASR